MRITAHNHYRLAVWGAIAMLAAALTITPAGRQALAWFCFTSAHVIRPFSLDKIDPICPQYL